MPNFLTDDKELLNDSLNSQKYINSNYNSYANECSNVDLKNDMINILKEEHDIQFDIYTEMHNRGWYPVENADQNKVTQLKQKMSTALNG